MNEEELLKILNKEKSYTEEDLLLFIYDLRKQNKELKNTIKINEKSRRKMQQSLMQKIEQKEKQLNEIKEYVENNSLYDEEYDYDYEENIYLSGIDDEVAKRDILSIIERNNSDE